jgi:endothelin-converting enzyme
VRIFVLTDTQKYYNPMLIDEADAIAPEIELKALLDGLAPANSKIERVIVMAPKYLKELSVILAATDKEVVQSYFVWKAVQSMSSYVDAEAVKPYKRFRNVLAGKVRTVKVRRWMPLLTITGPRIST